MTRPAVKSPAIILSTYPFADGFPWDEELIRSGRRALSTHGRSRHAKLRPLRLERTPAQRKAALERVAIYL